MYDFVTKLLVQGLWDVPVLAREHPAVDVRRALRQLGVIRPCRASDTLASGLQVVVDDRGTIRWLVVPVWQHGDNTGIVLQFQSSPKKWGNADLRLGFVGAAADAPVLTGRIAETEVREALVEHEAYWVQRAREDAESYEALQHQDPDIPDEVRPLATALLTAVVERRFEDVWQLGEGRGITPDVIEQVLQQVDIDTWPPPDPSEIEFVLPPRGLPANMSASEYNDGSGYHLEIPLWCTHGHTDLLLIVVVSRHPNRLSAYLHDIRDLS